MLSNNTLALGLKLHEVAPKITQLRQSVNVVLYLANPDVMAGLSEGGRAAVLAAGRDAEAFSADFLLSQQESAAATMRDQGAEIYALSDSELGQFKTAVRPVFDGILAAAGETGKAVADVLRPSW